MAIKVPLTTFVDFTTRSGPPKLTVVKRFKTSDEYSPASDFYKKLREAIVAMHEDGDDKTVLDEILAGPLNPKKRKSYKENIDGHKAFVGKKDIEWFKPPRATWSGGGITIAVNPELGLRIKGTSHVIKLYFKDEPLTKSRVSVVTHLMETTLASGAPRTFGVLDVRNGKLHTPNPAAPNLSLLLQVEAFAFATVFDGL